ATTTLDSANARTFSSFTRGGGMGLPEMTGSPNLTIVPDPSTFRVLPWAPGVGWILCDEYFNIGVPFHFSPRHLLRRQLRRLRAVENEWGPGQVECTFAAVEALAAADNYFLFRSSTRQICRRMDHFATFMCRPGPKGYYSSGWHLHQSLVDARSGSNLFMPT